MGHLVGRHTTYDRTGVHESNPCRTDREATTDSLAHGKHLKGGRGWVEEYEVGVTTSVSDYSVRRGTSRSTTPTTENQYVPLTPVQLEELTQAQVRTVSEGRREEGWKGGRKSRGGRSRGHMGTGPRPDSSRGRPM